MRLLLNLSVLIALDGWNGVATREQSILDLLRALPHKTRTQFLERDATFDVVLMLTRADALYDNRLSTVL